MNTTNTTPATPETGWLIEDQDHFPRHRWVRVLDGGRTASLMWTNDASLALRFARREDAVLFQKLHVDFCALTFVSEHAWG